MDCGPLNDPQNGHVRTSGTVEGATAMYSCSTTYCPINNTVRFCDHSGMWSGSEPSCESKLGFQLLYLVMFLL